jgi:hypothetical protein
MGSRQARMTGGEPVVRFRLHRARAVAGIIITISLLTLVPVSPWYALLLLPPLIWTGWAWRAGTDADREGLRIRALLATRRLPWSQVAAVYPEAGGAVTARLTSGGRLVLTAVTPADLPRLSATVGAAGRGDPPGPTHRS